MRGGRMKRFVEQLGEPFSFYSILSEGAPVAVRCPKCQGLAQIIKVKKESTPCIQVHCTQCMYVQREQAQYRYRASGICDTCERWYNLEINNQQQWGHKHIHIKCPYCHELNQTVLQKTQVSCYYKSDIKQGHDPIFNLEYYYKDNYQGKPVWALNQEHLNYLIDYISADLREKPSRFIHRTASCRLPKYMKLAKNRAGITKLLTKLSEQK